MKTQGLAKIQNGVPRTDWLSEVAAATQPAPPAPDPIAEPERGPGGRLKPKRHGLEKPPRGGGVSARYRRRKSEAQARRRAKERIEERRRQRALLAARPKVRPNSFIRPPFIRAKLLRSVVPGGWYSGRDLEQLSGVAYSSITSFLASPKRHGGCFVAAVNADRQKGELRATKTLYALSELGAVERAKVLADPMWQD